MIACSRPAPGPLTFTSISIMPLLRAVLAAFSAARPAANGVLLRAPLKPTVPAEAQEIVSPLVSVIVTIVLLNVALMWAIPRVTPLRIFFFLAAAFAAVAGLPAPVVAVSAMDLPVGATLVSPIACCERATQVPPLHHLLNSFTPFLPATVFLGPFLVRALDRVRCPRTGSDRRCRIPRYAPISR